MKKFISFGELDIKIDFIQAVALSEVSAGKFRLTVYFGTDKESEDFGSEQEAKERRKKLFEEIDPLHSETDIKVSYFEPTTIGRAY